ARRLRAGANAARRRRAGGAAAAAGGGADRLRHRRRRAARARRRLRRARGQAGRCLGAGAGDPRADGRGDDRRRGGRAERPDRAAATPAQRDAIPAARDQVFATFEATHSGQRAEMAEALTLWQADRLDTAKLAELRARHQAAAKQTGEAVVQALSDAHDALTQPQRQKLADYLRAHRPPIDGKSAEGMKPFFKHMITERVDDLLDDINARADQRDK